MTTKQEIERTVNLTALAEARAKMTPGVRNALLTVDRNGDIVDADDDPVGTCEDSKDAAAIVATHNAADVLIEVVRATIERDAALETFDDAMVPLYGAALEVAKDRLSTAGDAYRVAIAKVSL